MTEVRFDTQKIKFGLFLFCKTRLLNIQAIVAIDNAVKPLVAAVVGHRSWSITKIETRRGAFFGKISTHIYFMVDSTYMSSMQRTFKNNMELQLS